MACRVRTRVAVVAQVTIALLAEPLQDCGTELIAIDRLRQVHLKTRSEHTRALRAGRGQGDGRHRPPQSDVEVLKLREELAPSHFGRREVAHDDVGGERDSRRSASRHRHSTRSSVMSRSESSMISPAGTDATH